MKTFISSLYLKIILLFNMTALVFCMTASPLLADMHGYLDEDGFWRFNNTGNNLKEYNKVIKQASEKFEVESALITAVIKAESNFDHKAVSRKGAKGLMQIMPDTASLMNLEEPFNARENIIAGVRYLSLLLDRFKDNKTLALAAYNAGPETIEAYSGVPPFPETKNFVRKVLYYYKQFKLNKEEDIDERKDVIDY
jgi:soluble lytic murein transglycosylase-like protein